MCKLSATLVPPFLGKTRPVFAHATLTTFQLELLDFDDFCDLHLICFTSPVGYPIELRCLIFI